MYSFYPLQKINKEAAEVPIIISAIGIYYTMSSMESILLQGDSTTFRKVSAMSFESYYYGWIYIIDFFCYLLFGCPDFPIHSTKFWNNNI